MSTQWQKKRFSGPQMKRLASGKASGHSFHVSLKALIIICSSQPKWDCPGSLDADCWRSGRDPGSRLRFVFTSLIIIIIIFLHRTFYTRTSAPGTQQLARAAISREKWSSNFASRDTTQSYSSSHFHNLFIALTGFLRIWWNHKHRTAHQNRKIEKIRRNSLISFAAKGTFVWVPSGRWEGNLAIIVCKCPVLFIPYLALNENDCKNRMKSPE